MILCCMYMDAEEYMMLEDRVFCMANQYKKDYNPWYSSINQFNKLFKNELLKCKVKNLTVSDERVMLALVKEGVNR